MYARRSPWRLKILKSLWQVLNNGKIESDLKDLTENPRNIVITITIIEALITGMTKRVTGTRGGEDLTMAARAKIGSIKGTGIEASANVRTEIVPHRMAKWMVKRKAALC